MAPASIFLAITYAVIGLSAEPTLDPVPVGIETQVEIPEETLEQLRREVDAIFFSARVRLDWQPDDRGALIRVVLQDKPRHPVITGCSRDLHDHRLGLTRLDSRLVILWTEQVKRGAAGDWYSPKTPRLRRDKLGRALGRVLAHELGHLFMSLRKHRSRGLMRASFKYRDLTVTNRRRLLFSEDDGEKIRRGVELLLLQSGQTDHGDNERVEHEIN